MLTLLAATLALAQPPMTDQEVITAMRKKGLVELGAYRYLKELTDIGPRLTGSPEMYKAIDWHNASCRAMGATNVTSIPCLVPHWTRGNAVCTTDSGDVLNIAALGLSVGTPSGGIDAEVIEVQSLKEATALGDKAKGKIIFYNRPFDESLPSTGAMYGAAGDQRTAGPAAAAKVGAVASLNRSLTSMHDDSPHTGVTRYDDKGTKIPAAALGYLSADRLSAALKKGPVKLHLELGCQNYPDVPSGSPIGEIRGSEKPNEVIILGGHLDSWDLGRGAHDDGAGVVQAMEALRIIKEMGLKPKRTIRVIGWMNEETNGRGAAAYLEYAKKAPEKHIAALESDAGGYMPRGFGVSKDKLKKVSGWQKMLQEFGIERFTEGGGDADNSPLAEVGATLFSLNPETVRYFDLHHSAHDVIDNVHPRELEMGALSFAALVWLVSEHGL